MLDLTFRAFSKARWVTVATSRGILNASGLPDPGFEVDEIGDAQGDGWFWVNLRLHGAQIAADADALHAGETEDGFKFTKSKLVKFVRDQATPVNITVDGQIVRTYQFGAAANRIQLLDPRDYQAVRVREWFGGMNF